MTPSASRTLAGGGGRAGVRPAARPDRQARRALLTAGALVLGAALAAPFAGLSAPGSERFVPAYAAAILICEAVTAALLLAHYRAQRTSALWALAFGYLFVGLLAAPWALTFPGVFAEEGLLGGGKQTTAVISAVRRLAFPAAALAYALLRMTGPQAGPPDAVGRRAALCILAAVAATALVTWAALAGDALSPRFMMDARRAGAAWQAVAAASVLLSAAALAALAAGRRSALDVWLAVAVFAGLVEVALMSWLGGGTRFGFGWWAGRACGLASASVVMLALLGETTRLRTQLVRSLLAERQAQEERLATLEALSAALAHELNQPLVSVVAGAQTAWRWLDRPQPNLPEARDSLQRVAAEGDRAAEIVRSLRRAFDRRPARQRRVPVGPLLREAATLTRDSAAAAGVRIRVEQERDIPDVLGEETQLRQVAVNLLANAVDATIAAGRRGGEVVAAARRAEHGMVAISVADSGTGLPPEGGERLFAPFVSTRAEGMGLGLTICRAVVEAHRGRIRAAPNAPRGAVFTVTLPAMESET